MAAPSAAKRPFPKGAALQVARGLWQKEYQRYDAVELRAFDKSV
jgi:hypothetical protein